MFLNTEPISPPYSGGGNTINTKIRHPYLIQYPFAVDYIPDSVVFHILCYIILSSPLCYSLAIYPILLCFNIKLLCPFHLTILTQCYLLHEAYVYALCIINPRRACAARVTVVVLCVCVSTTILGLQATRRLMSYTNSFSATRVRKRMLRFC